MPTSPKKRIIALNFPGGTITASLGLLEAVFGADLTGAGQDASAAPVTVNGHSRVRVIGGPATAVGAYSYARSKFPVSKSSPAAGGEPIALQVGGKFWTARLSGSHQRFCQFLEGASLATTGPLFWKSEKGTGYGPFNGAPSQP